MTLQNYLKEKWNDESINYTPAYFFDTDIFTDRIIQVKNALGDNIPLTYSIKANPFLLNCIPEQIAHVEVCSPGELTICQRMNIPADRIIYSGVMKEKTDIARALNYGVGIFTAESLRHLEMENELAMGMDKQKVILRLTSGNQFGMSPEDIKSIIANKEKYNNMDIYGIHYYSGTQKKKTKQIEKDIVNLTKLLESLNEEFDYQPSLVEYGPGFAVDYFSDNYDEEDSKMLEDGAKLIKDFAAKYPVGIEMGRFLAAPCGTFVTQVKDLKYSSETNYVICDGGIHHLKYYGQTMAMQIPPIWVNSKTEFTGLKKDYCICGSLCTVADVLVREVNLDELRIGDYIGFGRCGAYSVTEGSLLFLSRTMPEIYVYSHKDGCKKLRKFINSDILNVSDYVNENDAEVLPWN